MTDQLTAEAFLEGLWSRAYQPEDAARLTNPQEREKALPVLIAMVTDPQEWVCHAAIKALGVLGDQQAVEPLLTVLETAEPDFDVEEDLLSVTIEALVAIGDPETIVPLMRHPSGASDERLFNKILEFDTDDLVRVLSEVVRHPDASLRLMALSLLGSIDDPRSIKLVIEALHDQVADIRSAAALYLGQLRATEAVPFLFPCAVDPDKEVRKHTAITLGKLGNKQAIPVLLPLLNDERHEIRMHAGIALGKLGDPSGLDLIHEYIASGYKTYRWGYFDDVLEAVETLHASVGPRFIRMLNRVPAQYPLKDSTWIMITEIFAEEGDPDALPLLEPMLKSGDEAVRLAAQQAIDRIRVWMKEGK